MTEEDELNKLGHRVKRNKEEGSKGTPASAVFEPEGVSALITLQANLRFEQEATRVHEDVTRSVVEKALQEGEPSPSSRESPPSTEVVMHIWDCGGQPVFLDILSAFLTQRTMFLLLFDASMPSNSKYQEIWRHKGEKRQGQKQNITILQLMMQWMRLIHASLVAKDEWGTADKESEATQHEATVERRQSSLSDRCPRMMIIGTHGDRVQPKQQQDEVLSELKASCEDMPFQDILECKLIVDNTRAGGKEEDSGYKRIRTKIYDFTKYLTIDTPNAWLSFRKVLQDTVDSPALLYEEVIPIAKKCGIPKEVVPSVLHFYHQLGVFLHYTRIESLRTTIIVKPQWLIQQLCKLLMPEMFGSRDEHLTRQWNDLEEKGVLMERLYQGIWKKCELRGGAQALVDLMEYFDLAKKINSVPREMQQCKGYMYFVPCMLKVRSQEGAMEGTIELPQETLRKAETLHITFTTGCTPPGFFVRLAARMINSERCTLSFERGIYRNSITFRCGELDRVTISESKSLESVQVDFIRVAKRKQSAIHFADSCLAFRRELSTMCKEALRWFPSIEHDFAFRCSCSKHAGEHFAIIDDETHRESQVFCQRDRPYRMNSGHKYWLEPEPSTSQVSTVSY